MDRSSAISLVKLIRGDERPPSADAGEIRRSDYFGFLKRFSSLLIFPDAEFPKRVGENFRLSIP
jgi:hypothetical protein